MPNPDIRVGDPVSWRNADQWQTSTVLEVSSDGVRIDRGWLPWSQLHPPF